MTYLRSVKNDISKYDNISDVTKLRSGFEDQPLTGKFEMLFDDASREFTLQPKAPITEFNIYYKNEKITINSAKTIIISDTNGLHYIYYNTTTNSLAETMTFDSGLILATNNRVLVSIIYWNVTEGKASLVALESHTVARDLLWHLYTHDTVGAVFGGGGAISGYNLEGTANTDITFQLEDITFADEDLFYTIENGTPSNNMKQNLRLDRSGVLLDTLAQIPVLYREGVGGIWKEDLPTDYAFKIFVGGGGRLAINQDLGGGNWDQVEVANRDYCTVLIVATNDSRYPIKAIQGQYDYVNLPQAEAGFASELTAFGQLPSAEITILYRILLQTSGAYGNARNCRIIQVEDLRSISIPGGNNAVISSHTSLSDLDYDSAGHTNFQRVYYPLNTAGIPSGDYDSADTAGVGIEFKESDMINDTSANDVYICVDSTPTSAVWKKITP